MAFTGSKKLTTAQEEEKLAASAVKNYGSFNTSSQTNSYLKDRDTAYDAVSNYGDFNASDALKATEQNKINAENAVNNYGDFSYGLQSSYDDIINKILNREKFSYDVNGDALYQQYKDQYVNMGKLASADAMGQAAAMTGGYGNSYAQSVGQQTYQGYLQQLTDKIPELYQLALNKYNSEGDELRNQYSVLSDDRTTKYGEWSDGYNRKVAERDYYGTDYYNKYNQEYGAYTDKYGRLKDQYSIAADAYNTGFNQDYTKWESALNQLIDQRDYTGKVASNLYNQEYTSYSDQVAHDLALAQLAEEQRQFDANLQLNTSGTAKLSNGTTVKKEEEFTPYQYAYSNDDGQAVFTYNGKEVKVQQGLNPYTRTKNPDSEYGTFANGYQPNNVGVIKKNGKEVVNKLTKSGITDVVNGVTQNVWKDLNGKLWIWDGTQNAYLRYTE